MVFMTCGLWAWTGNEQGFPGCGLACSATPIIRVVGRG